MTIHDAGSTSPSPRGNTEEKTVAESSRVWTYAEKRPNTPVLLAAAATADAASV